MTSSCTASAVSSRSNRTNKIIAACIIILVALVSLPLEAAYYWWGDNVVYGYYPYMYLNLKPAMELTPVNNMADVITANNLNFLQWNGRYVAHFFVILFCGLSNPHVFAIFNSLMWALFIVLLVKVSGKRLSDVTSVIFSSSLALCLMSLMGRGPAIQVNYIWMFCLTLGWILAFQKYREVRKVLPVIGLGVFSLIAGNGQEAVNVGVMGALLVLLIHRRARFSAAEWVMGLCFCAGCLADCLAPSTLGRQGMASGGSLAFQVIYYILIKYMYLPVPLLFLLFVTIMSKGFRKNSFLSNLFYWSAFGFILLFMFALGIRSGNQYFGMMLFIAILSIRMMRPGMLRNVLSAIIIICSIPPIYKDYVSTRDYGHFLAGVEKDFRESPDGVIYADPVDPNTRELFQNHRDCMVLITGQEKPITVLPSNLKEIAPGEEPNLIKQYSPSSYLVVQSKAHPAEFEYDLSFRFMGYTRPLEHTVLDFSEATWESDTYRAMLVDGYWFLHHEISMKQPTEPTQSTPTQSTSLETSK